MLTATSDPVVLYQALCWAADEIEQLKRERDEAREENAKLRDIAERAVDDLRWFYEGKSDSLVNELDKLKGAK
jgi:hypothetical protein